MRSADLSEKEREMRRPSTSRRPRLLMLLGLAAAVAVLLGFGLLGGCTDGEEHPPEGSPDTSLLTSTTGAPRGAQNTEPEPEKGIRLVSLTAEQLPDNFARCPECHSQLDTHIRRADIIAADFSHQLHLDKGATCDSCHETPTHRKGGTVRPPMEKCFDGCHSQKDKSAPTGECAACHPDGFPLEPPSHEDVEWLPQRELMEEKRGKHTSADPRDPKECEMCHSASFCRSCHQMDMPHPGEWEKNHKQTAQEVGGSACNTCHPDKEGCKACHHKGYEKGGPSWEDIHKVTAAEEGIPSCIGCHTTKTCAHCHVTGEYKEYD
jgi:hypothetical protein